MARLADPVRFGQLRQGEQAGDGLQVVSASLLTGATLAYQAGRFDPAEVLRVIEREKVTTWGSVPAMVTRVMEHPDFGRATCPA